MEIRTNLELVEVEFENNGNKAVMTFLDRERKEVRAVNFNKQAFKDGKFFDDPEKAEKVETWCHEIFGCSFSELAGAIGTRHDVYVYDRFNSLFETKAVAKFTADQVGEVYQTEVKEIIVDDYSIRIRYDVDGTTYESKMTYGTYLKATNEWFVDPQKKEKVYDRFADKFGVTVDKAQTLTGHKLMVEVKSAFGENYYGDIKKFPKKK